MSTTATAPAGWYSNPTDATCQRWWDGAAWTEHVSSEPPVPLVSLVSSAPSVPSVPSIPSIPAVPWAQTGHGYHAMATTWMPEVQSPLLQSPNTVWIWLLAFGSFISGFTIGVAQGLLLAIGAAAGGSPAVLLTVGFIVGFVPVWVLAGLDIRALRQRGYQTASILFMLLIPPLVYFAARGRMLRRDGVRSRGPEIAFLIVIAVNIGSGIIGAVGAASLVAPPTL